MSALEGLKVVDLSRYLSGPTLTMLLADLGADVIKVETLPHGDPARQSGPFHGAESVYYMASNRNKRSFAVDLRRPEGLELVLRLIDEADVFVQNFRPGTVEKMGLGEGVLRARNPRLIYVNISGFGSVPPGDALPGFDQTAQAMSGLMSVTGTPETGALRVGIAVSDSTTGIFSAVGVLAALHERNRTGRGSLVEASLMESTLTLMSYQAQKYLSLGVVPGQDGNDHPIMFPQGTFRAKDASITLASGNERMWRQLCTALHLEELAEDQRFADNAGRMQHRVELRRLIEGVLSTKPASVWIRDINDAGVPCARVLDLEEALTHPITQSLNMVETVGHSALGEMKVLGQAVKVEGSEAGWLRRPAPLLGEHTAEIAQELGVSAERLNELVEVGVLQEPPLAAPRVMAARA
ncbi:CaiB/BaiF CoA transferase family protein [Leifsonia sp. NPDC056665]|uniref:CaiB/BaiF CoA transferase family protein n=1 Tax=Leifsonia sp. NPDC056665 TaxID=3345901 RepID=UPI0036C652FE